MGMIHIEEIQLNISNAARKLHAREAWLFGSYARGEASEDSDIDILFVVDNDESHLSLIRSARKEMRGWHVSKDILVYQNDEFQDWKKVVGSLCFRVKEEGMQLYEA